MRIHVPLEVIGLSLLLAAVPALSQGINFSTASPAAIDGPGGPGTTQFGDGDVVQIDVGSSIGSIYLLAETINNSGLPDLNALYVAADGSIIFSTQSGAVGYDFEDDQLVQYDPVTDTLSLFYDFGGLISTSGDADIDGFHLLANGNFLISNTSDFSIGGESFLNGDIVLWDPVSQNATAFFSESLFDGSDDIWVRSVHLLDESTLLLSAFNESTGGLISLGGVTFGRGDLVAYDLTTGLASLFLDSSVFGGATEDIDAVSFAVVPLPPAVWLFISGLALLGRRKLHR